MRRIVRSMLALCATALLSGCIAIYGHRDVVVEVTDLETGQPAAGVELTFSYPAMFVVNSPETISAVTPESGRLELRIPTYREGGYWTVWKKDAYLMTGLHSPFSEWAREKMPDVIDGDYIRFRMIRVPQPMAEFLLPQGFTGVLRLQFEPHPITPGPITRRFEIDVPSDGLVRITETGGLQAVDWHEATCRNPDGTVIPHADLSRKTDPATLGKFWLGSAPGRVMYFIGSAEDAKRAYEMVNIVTYDELGGRTEMSDEARFTSVFENPALAND